MGEFNVTTRDGGSLELGPASLAAFRGALRGELLVAGDPGYDDARSVWNAMIDRHPAMIVRCAGPGDVQQAVALAKKTGLRLSVKGAGHNIAGTGVCDGGLAIDLGAMNDVAIDPERRRAHVSPGARLSDFDAAAQRHGLATPLGINSTTGVSGLTLGGGFGWLTRKYGLSIDNLVSVDVVTADGALLHASESQLPDLFWGIRGGGGNFGAVTCFEFALHPVGPEVHAGLVVHPFDDAKAMLQRYREFATRAPEEMTTWVVMRHAPPLPFLPPEQHGARVLILAACDVGAPADRERRGGELRAMGAPIAAHYGPSPYAAWQQAFDPLLSAGARNYWKSHNFRVLDDGLFDVMIEAARTIPSPECEIFLGQIDGAANRIAEGATAYPHRDVRFVTNVHARWRDPEEDAKCIAWARAFDRAAVPFATGGVYVNFIAEGDDRVRAAFGSNYDRLAELKRRFDPDNLFCGNQNVRPVQVTH